MRCRLMVAKFFRLAELAIKQLARHRVRSLLTIFGVAMAMIRSATVDTMLRSLRLAT